MANGPYVVDCCSLIYAWRDFYTPKAFPNVWEWIDDHIEADQLISHNEVLQELDFPEDLREWCDERRHIFTDADEVEQQLVTRLLSDYPIFRPQGGKMKWADPWIIARAHLNQSVVVTQEKPGSPKRIPFICEAEGIECITIQEMVNRLGDK